MAVQQIVQFGDPALRETCRRLEFDEDADLIAELITDLMDTLRAADGAGLSAPQIGIPVQMFVLNPKVFPASMIPDHILINPEIVERGDGTESESEGCLSIPGYRESVTRARYCKVKYQTKDGHTHFVEADGLSRRFLARCLQHEIDHLGGILMVDHLEPARRKVVMKQLVRKARAA